MMAPIGPTEPQAGVIATRPATAPDAPPSIEGLPLTTPSASVQDSVAAAVANRVLRKASAAPDVASRLEPALKPNQPTHSIEAPTMVNVSECGAMRFAAVADALADQIGADQAGHTGVDVHHGAAGEVERALARAGSRRHPRPCARSAGSRR